MARLIEIWTVGHSDRSAGALLGLLREAGIERVVDVRSAPWSRRHPWHARPELEQSLGAAGISYRWSGAVLGGLGPDSLDERRHTPAYEAALDGLVREAAEGRTAILCAERDPHHCHRQVIAEDLAARGVIVRHLIDPGVVESHQPPLGF